MALNATEAAGKMIKLLDFLAHHFRPAGNYFVQQKNENQIEKALAGCLQFPGQNRERIKMNRKARRELDVLNRKIGWVPDSLPRIFLADTVELEIAEALAARDNLLFAEKQHCDEALALLTEFQVLPLAGKNPFYLSAGESKLIWLLTQLAKQPEYLIIGNLSLNLSRSRIEQLLEYFEKLPTNVHGQLSIILGLSRSFSQDNLLKKITQRKWKLTEKWIEV